MKAVKIMWDVDDETDLEHLPREMDIPVGMTDRDEISDYLSDTTGFCHKGFSIEYRDGEEFFRDLESEYGRAEAIRKVKGYLTIPISHLSDKDQKEEITFREEIMDAMRKTEDEG